MLDFNDQNIMKGDFNRNYVSGEGQDFFDGFEISTALFFGENCHIFFATSNPNVGWGKILHKKYLTSEIVDT